MSQQCILTTQETSNILDCPEKCPQQVVSGNPSSVLGTGKIQLDSPEQEEYEHAGVSLVNGHLWWEEKLRTGIVQPGEW